MFVDRSGPGVIVRAPAKLNLFLEVRGKRSDGFHEIETLMVPVNLYDTLYFRTEISPRVRIDCGWASGCRDDSMGDLPGEADNLVLRAVEVLRERAGIEAGATVTIVKRIPSAAGLGGASSDAAAALLAANTAWRLGWSRAKLSAAASQLGSDVPFFVGAGPAICRGRGEQLQPVRGLSGLHFVIVRPPRGLSTAAVYGRCTVPEKPRCPAPLVDALQCRNMRAARCLVHNRLQSAATELSPWIDRTAQEISRLDCVAAHMSGSGTSFFGICHHARHARRVAARLSSRGVGRVYTVRS
jgi:4-diphosphocytidyl-2-C-methyl-D-erythritol kinase